MLFSIGPSSWGTKIWSWIWFGLPAQKSPYFFTFHKSIAKINRGRFCENAGSRFFHWGNAQEAGDLQGLWFLSSDSMIFKCQHKQTTIFFSGGNWATEKKTASFPLPALLVSVFHGLIRLILTEQGARRFLWAQLLSSAAFGAGPWDALSWAKLSKTERFPPKCIHCHTGGISNFKCPNLYHIGGMPKTV